MIAVERQRDGAPRASRPLGGSQPPSGTDTVDDLAPLLLRPLPGFEGGLRSVHYFVLLVHASHGRPDGKGDDDGRSGEIRTHDPQHPMLMRYQAALRSDRGRSAIRSIIMV